MSEVVQSPCISECALQDNHYCKGCYRTGDEIAQWIQLSEEEKAYVVNACHQRRKEMAV